MAITDIRMTVLQIVNEVQRKLGLSATSNLTANSQARVLVDHLNDVLDDLADYGNWFELLASSNTTVVSGQTVYSVNVSSDVVVKNLGDIRYGTNTAPMINIGLAQMRRIEGGSENSFGDPRQFSIYGTDTNGNPQFKVHPKPGATQAGDIFSVLYFTKPRILTTSDSSFVVPFPARVVVQGLLAKAILDEDGGAPTDNYSRNYQLYELMKREAFNRMNGNTGYDVKFKPSSRRGSRRSR